jgi:peroxiredoxin
VTTALAAAVALVAVLGMQRRAQDERYATLLRDTSLPRGGMYVPTFTAPTVDGAAVTIGERTDGGKQVLFLFTTTCPYCKASLPAVREVALAAAQEPAPGAAMYGIALDSLSLAAEYAAANDLRFPIVEFPARKLRHLYRARSVPIILVLNPEGRVVLGRTGVLENREAIDSIVQAIRWSTPDPARPTAAAAAAGGPQ